MAGGLFQGVAMSLKSSLFYTSSAFAFTLFISFGASQAADLADVGKTDFCAVSAPNGKLSVNGGIAADNTVSSTASFGATGSVSLPVGCSFGLQIDGGIQNELNDTTFGGVVHAFTRDPNAYLLGVTGGYFADNGSNLWLAGPEAELYAGRFSLEAWGGFANVNVNGVGATNQGFILADAAFYPTDDLRLSLGGTVVGSAKFARAEIEYQIASPLSAKLSAKIGDDNYVAVNAGLTLYFGANKEKSLIRRHREDDPRNRMLDFAGVNNTLVKHTGKPGPTTTTPFPTSTPPIG